MSTVQLFISHSEKDWELACGLTEWLQLGIGLQSEEIRCTAVTGLPPGENAAIELRRDLEAAKVVIGTRSRR